MLVVERLTSQTVSGFIFQKLYSEAATATQTIDSADSLNFSDQLTFGKFFKRKSGVSPRQFRKELAIF
ncbi:hypothetical protein K3G39_00085 [Pontibacter sp. HSC-14F20]|uniref:hypothetical protein n=1 Tax=Pontibacter sp. HSC-14F20 TaxID=2864136 RepID=UPI001C73B1AA|nr:hypothetical protein [Pontibacter sp. HSC-14F20]MBX0331629.1 hypothetical protein [Pontibacter sp. HSC-14F20]